MSDLSAVFLEARLRKTSIDVLFEDARAWISSGCFAGNATVPVVAVAFHDNPKPDVYMNVATYIPTRITGDFWGNNVNFVFAQRQKRNPSTGVLHACYFSGILKETPAMEVGHVVVPRTWATAEPDVSWALTDGYNRCFIEQTLHTIVVTPHAMFGDVESPVTTLEKLMHDRYFTAQAVNVGDVLFADARGTVTILALYTIETRACSALYLVVGNGRDMHVNCFVANSVNEWDSIMQRKARDLALTSELQPFKPLLSLLPPTSMDNLDIVQLQIREMKRKLRKTAAGVMLLRKIEDSFGGTRRRTSTRRRARSRRSKTSKRSRRKQMPRWY